MNDMPATPRTTERVQTWLDGSTLHIRFNNPAQAQRAVGRHVGGGAAAAAHGRKDDDRVRLVVFSGEGEQGVRLRRRHLAVRGHARRAARR